MTDLGSLVIAVVGVLVVFGAIRWFAASGTDKHGRNRRDKAGSWVGQLVVVVVVVILACGAVYACAPHADRESTPITPK